MTFEKMREKINEYNTLERRKETLKGIVDGSTINQIDLTFKTANQNFYLTTREAELLIKDMRDRMKSIEAEVKAVL